MSAFAIIMAGGNGERFWPLSTPERPKQFLDLFGGKALIRHAVDRLEGLIPFERIYVVTAERFVGLTREVLPMLPAANIVGEPCRRDTAAAVATACGIVLQKGGEDAVGCILTADQLIEPAEIFRETLADAITLAQRSASIVTMGIIPTRPDTGFGYIECADSIETGTRTVFHRVKRFVEKPNEGTAKFYLANGGFLWNAGMFVWTAKTLQAAFRAHAADLAPLVDAVAGASDISAAVNAVYPGLRAISFDFAVMERAQNILIAESRFTWDDVGTWSAVAHHFPQDEDGNTVLGQATTSDDEGAVVVNLDGNHRLIVAGLKDVVVVHTPAGTLVCANDQLKNMKQLLK